MQIAAYSETSVTRRSALRELQSATGEPKGVLAYNPRHLHPGQLCAGASVAKELSAEGIKIVDGKE